MEEVMDDIINSIKNNDWDRIKYLVDQKVISVNMCDSVGNDLVVRALKAHQYDLVIYFMKKRGWSVNHQNSDGDTFGHVLASINSPISIEIFNVLVKKTRFLPNIVNNKGETIFDIAINNNYLSGAFKILEDKRFNLISVSSFKKLIDTCIKNKSYGKYSKLNNLEIIVDNLEKKRLNSTMSDLINNISNNMDTFKRDVVVNNSRLLDGLINSYIKG